MNVWGGGWDWPGRENGGAGLTATMVLVMAVGLMALVVVNDRHRPWLAVVNPLPPPTPHVHPVRLG